MSNPKELAKITPSVLDFLSQPHIGRLATTDGLQPHVVPVWYEWDGQGVWISSFRSTRKIKELQRIRRGLKTLVDACPGHGDLERCPIVAALSGEEER